MNLSESPAYRKDIDGLRAVAVIVVIVFHMGFLPNGFLGVDVFFVISGFLITGIIYPRIDRGEFSLVWFYMRRTRRILPLALSVCLIALVIGCFTMLPDDLENLAQSVIATNFFGNNVLEYLKRLDYWGVVNEYKPLMHTWSLGVEEQFYVVYPLLLIVVRKIGRGLIVPVLYLAAFGTLGWYFWSGTDPVTKFYLPGFRFWELLAGGIAAIHLRGRVVGYGAAWFPLLLLFLVMVAGQRFLSGPVSLVLAVLLTTAVLAAGNWQDRVAGRILENPVAVFVGKISFSLYMWHQVVFAFARYFWKQDFTTPDRVGLLGLIFVLSVGSYYLIEQPFRDKRRTSARMVLGVLAVLFVVSTGLAGYVVGRSGVLRDVPELDIRSDNAAYGIHAQYNGRIYKKDVGFAATDRIRVLVVGDSFGRDWANVLLESRYVDRIEISYVCWVDKHPEARARMRDADVIFASRTDIDLMKRLEAPLEKVWAVGTKSFGTSNGVFYNHRGEGYFAQRTPMQKGVWEANERFREMWGDRFIDLIGPVADKERRVPVFTPDGKFISQDTNHLTPAGARFYAGLVDATLSGILERR